MRGHAAARRQNSFGGVHAVDVLRRGLDAHQNDLAALAFEQLRLFRGEHDLAARRAGRSRQAGGEDLALGFGIDGRMQQLLQRRRIDAGHRFLFCYQFLLRQFDGDAQRGLPGALAIARLQHPQLALLDGEFEILHVAVMLFELGVDAKQFSESLRQRRLHRRLVGRGFLARGLGDLLRRADAGDHVLALGVDQKLAVEFFLAGRGIAREGDAGGRGLAHISEHHGLHVDRGAPAFRNAVQAAIGDGALIHPRAEHRAYGAPQLRVRVLRERLAGFFLDTLLVARDDLGPVLGVEIGVERVAVAVLMVVEDFLEVMMADAEHDVGIHGDEAAVAVLGETPVAGLFRERIYRDVVEAEIEHGVHHAGHRGARARAHRNQQGIFGVAEFFPGDAADFLERGLDLRLQALRIGFAVLVEIGADVGGDGKAGRHRQAEVRHFGKPRAFAAEEVAHAGAGFRFAAAEGIDPLALRRCLRRCGFTHRRAR